MLTILTGKYVYLVGGLQDGIFLPKDNGNDPGGNQVPGLEQHKDGHQYTYSPIQLCAGLNTYFITATRFQLLLHDLSFSNIDDYR